jgi:3-methyladenine DNA glycosylase AlkD
MHLFAATLIATFEHNADPERAIPMKAYMKDIDEFYGISAPLRKELFREARAQFPKDILNDWSEISLSLAKHGKREAMYCAIEFAEKAHRQWDKSAIDTLLALILHHSWWDSVDALAPLIGIYFKKFPDERDAYIDSWMKSGNFWLQRTCLLFQKRYKQDTDETLLYTLCLRLANEKEFFIRKGMGWALREYSYVNPASVQSFIEKYPLSALTKKEAMKVIMRRNYFS